MLIEHIAETRQRLGRGGILALTNVKGGVGKSTLSINFAGRLAALGVDVVLVDVDRRESSHDWADIRRQTDLPAVHSVKMSGRAVAGGLLELAKRWEIVIVDTPGADGPELRGAVLAADLAVVPSKGSGFDLWQAVGIAEILGQVASMKPTPTRGMVVFNEVSPHRLEKDTGMAQEYLGASRASEVEGFDLLDEAKTSLRVRSTFRRAPAFGATVWEYEPRDAAAIREANALVAEVFEKLARG